MIADSIVNHGFQFPDIPGEMIGGEEGEQLPGGSGYLFPEGMRRLSQEMFHQKGQIAEPFPERGDMDMVDEKPVIKIVPKKP